MTKRTEFTFILKPSKIDGIGVFATHDIPLGSDLSSEKFSPGKRKIKDVPAEFQKYCIFLNEEDCLCPREFDRMEIGWFINHSDKPNVAAPEKYLVTICDIKAGDEILIDYNQFNEPENLKENYYKK